MVANLDRRQTCGVCDGTDTTICRRTERIPDASRVARRCSATTCYCARNANWIAGGEGRGVVHRIDAKAVVCAAIGSISRHTSQALLDSVPAGRVIDADHRAARILTYRTFKAEITVGVVDEGDDSREGLAYGWWYRSRSKALRDEYIAG